MTRTQVLNKTAESTSNHPAPLGTTAVIKLANLQHNAKRVRDYAPNAKLLAMIKANAYGHGVLESASALSQYCDGFGVALLEEGINLREAGFKNPIVVLQGVFTLEQFQLAAQHDVIIVIHDESQLSTLLSFKPQDVGNICVETWCKLDTGMHRLGLPVDIAEDNITRIQKCPHLQLTCVMSHFACADTPSHALNTTQAHRFQHVTTPTCSDPLITRSLANSAALISQPDSHYDWVRPGIMLYGSSPLENKTAQELDLKPVMTLQSDIIAVRNIQAGETVGYGATWTAMEKTRLAVVSIGYGDGYPRHIQDSTPVLIRGQRFPIVGRVSMDLIVVNINDEPSIAPGERVTLWGEGLDIDEIAAQAGTISYELMCQITSRVKRIYLDAE